MSDIENRRERLFAKMKENSAAVVFAGVSKLRSEDDTFPFQSNRHFFYLSNIEQENSVLLFVKGISEKKVYLFIDDFNELKEKWTGKRLTIEEAKKISRIQNVYLNDSFESMLSLALVAKNNQYGQIDTLYLDLSPELKIKDSFSTQEFEKFIAGEYSHIKTINIYPMITELRMVKSSEEIGEILNAINGTNNGISQIINDLKPGLLEMHIADSFEFFGRKHGFRELAFSSIVASGKNATCLHYPSQNDVTKDNDLILFDIGYKSHGYCADISRTFPVSGVFSGLAKEVYQSVLNCNKAVIDYVREGMTIAQVQEFTREFLKKECVKLGLLREDEDVVKYYYHNVSHHLGLNTHDCADREKPLENGNVITVEPGLYLADRGFGVRIEDDVLISNGRGECLSKGIVKEIKDIERMFKSRF
ncbi:MAG TPA: Xaa-Pro aminopeptidase [Bacilli bacterium]|nr:Xaa-Pro aminopeptidase [Bacilli bacterium]